MNGEINPLVNIIKAMNHDILQRYIEGNSNQQEKEDIAKWLDTDEENMQQYLLLRGVYDASLWNSNEALLQTKNEESTEDPNRKNRKRIKLIQEILKVAAVFLIALGCYHLFLSPELDIMDSNITLQTVYAPEGQRAEVVLSDGTKVWLNAKSSLTFPNQFANDNRIVELNGEAYFDVAHNETRKFIVKTEVYQIKVHGTEFNVNAYSDNNNLQMKV